jgi:(R,R)-butanediol dehydrogenase/meso-butanediol dehydrogenase/diacetyl reductase
MPAAVYQGERTIVVEELPVPAPAAGEVVIEVSHCGICGSDLHFMMEDWSKPGSVHGHEYSGSIVATGEGVDGWTVGDRVVGGPGHGCGQCEPCLAGRTHLCLSRDRAGLTPHQGAFAAFKAIDVGSLFRIPDGLGLRSAALAEPMAVALRGVRRSGVKPGQAVLVTGAGPIGMFSVAVLRAIGVTDITVSEPGERRRELALAVGAARTVLPDELVTPRFPMDVVESPFHAALECSGRPDAMEAALGQLGRSGTLVLSGTGIIRPEFDTNRVILNELVITGTCEYTRQDFDDSLTMLASNTLPLDLLIETEDVPLGRMQRAMEQLVSGELAGKVLVVPHA